MDITLMGTGTSHGMPVIGCKCPRCTSSDEKDVRLRCSALVRGKDGTTLVIDTGPEFRIQALQYNIEKIDAALITHSHADHLHGLDDLRIFANSKDCEKALPVYANNKTIQDIKKRFSYVFDPHTQQGGGKPHLQLLDTKSLSTTFSIGNLYITPIPLFHGDIEVCGWKISEYTESEKSPFFAYLTDCNYIPEESLNMVKNTDYLVIDGLRKRPHATHCNFDEACAYAKIIGAKKTFITHICHDHSNKEIELYLKKKGTIFPAYDGLLLKL